MGYPYLAPGLSTLGTFVGCVDHFGYFDRYAPNPSVRRFISPHSRDRDSVAGY